MGENLLRSHFPGKYCYIAIFRYKKMARGKGYCPWVAPAIDIQLLSLCFDKPNSPDIGLIFLSLNNVLKKVLYTGLKKNMVELFHNENVYVF